MNKKTASILAALLVLVTAAPLAAQSWRTESKSRQNRGQDFLDVRIKYAVGRFNLERGSDRLLYRVNTRYDEDVFDLRSDYFESDASNTPLAVNIKLGAAEADLDFGGLNLEKLVYETGASDTHIRFSEPNRGTAEYCSFKAAAAAFRVDDLGNSRCERISFSGGVGDLELDFSGEWKHDATADINVGLGGIEIRVPDDLGVRVEKSTFLMSFDAPGLVEQGDGVWLSRNWDDARHHLTITVSGALGGIKIARR